MGDPGPGGPAGSGERQVLPLVVAVCVVAGLIALCFVLVERIVAPEIIAGSGPTEGGGRIADVVYLLELAEAYGSGAIPSPYDPEAQSRVLTAFYGTPGITYYSMPTGMTPPSFWAWSGLLWAVGGKTTAAVSAWLTASISALAAAVLAVYRRIRRSDRRNAAVFLCGALVLLASLPVRTAVMLGQTSLLATAGLLAVVVAVTMRRGGGDGGVTPGGPERLLLLVGFCLLVWKPTYVLIGAATLALLGHVRKAVVGVASVATATLVLCAVLDPGLLVDYLGQLLSYSGATQSAYYSPSAAAATGGSAATVRTLLGQLLNREAAAAVSWLLLLAVVASLAALIQRASRSHREAPMRERRGDGTAGAVAPIVSMIGLFAVYLLLSPDLGRYEDVALMVPFAALWLVADTTVSFGVAGAVITGLAAVAFVPVPTAGGMILPLTAKVLALGALLFARGEMDRHSGSTYPAGGRKLRREPPRA